MIARRPLSVWVTLAACGYLYACVRETPSGAPPTHQESAVSEQALALRPSKIGSTLVMSAKPRGNVETWRLEIPSSNEPTFVALRFEQEGIDVALRLTTRSDRWEIDGTNGDRGPEFARLIVAPREVVRVEVHAPSAQVSGRYDIVLEALRPAREREQLIARAERTFAMGEALRRRRDGAALRRALGFDRHALALFRRMGDDARAADVLDRLGRIHQALGEGDAATLAYREAITLFREQTNLRSERDALGGLGLALAGLGEIDPARQAFERALTISRAEREPRAEAVALTNLGRLETQSGHTERAIRALTDALALFRRLDEPIEAAKTLGQLGRLWARVGEPERAQTALETAVTHLEAAGRTQEAADFLTDLPLAGDDAASLSLLRRLVALQTRVGNDRGSARARAELGRFLLERDPYAAEAELSQALTTFERLGLQSDAAATRSLLGDQALVKRWFDRAIDHYSRAASQLATAGDGEREAWARIGWARALRGRGDRRAAFDITLRAIDSVETLRRTTRDPELRAALLASRRVSSELAIDLSAELAAEVAAQSPARRDRELWIQRGFELSERAHARSLLDLVAAEPESPPLLSLEALRHQVFADQERDEPTELLEISLGSLRSHAWLVTSNHIEHFDLPPRANLEALLRRAHTLLASADRTLVAARAEAALDELSRALLSPLAAHWASSRSSRLLIVPDGLLHLVPFAALRTPDGRPLIAEREIVVLPSASVLAAQRARFAARGHEPRTRGVVVIADPVYSNADPRVDAAALGSPQAAPPRLLGTLREAKAILALAPERPRLALFGFDAERRKILNGALAPFSVVHFATHANIEAKTPARSAIELSRLDRNGRPLEGRLRAAEIERLDLAADLVVLSGCRTALGRELGGEGLLGLTQSFFRAGTRRVLVTLWPIDDQETALFMTRFYRALWKDRETPAAALRTAQTAADRGPTAAWAGFVLQGEWR